MSLETSRSSENTSSSPVTSLLLLINAKVHAQKSLDSMVNMNQSQNESKGVEKGSVHTLESASKLSEVRVSNSKENGDTGNPKGGQIIWIIILSVAFLFMFPVLHLVSLRLMGSDWSQGLFVKQCFTRMCFPAGLDFDNSTFGNQKRETPMRHFVRECRNANGIVIIIPELPTNQCYENPFGFASKMLLDILKFENVTLTDLGYQPVYDVQPNHEQHRDAEAMTLMTRNSYTAIVTISFVYEEKWKSLRYGPVMGESPEEAKVAVELEALEGILREVIFIATREREARDRALGEDSGVVPEDLSRKNNNSSARSWWSRA